MHFSDFKSTSISLVKSELDYDRLKLLLLEFATGIDFDLDFRSFVNELATINEIYASPSGIAFILTHHNNTIGCVTLTKEPNQVASIKRLFVRNIFRHQEYLRQLLSVAIDWAGQSGIRKIRVETSDVMATAIKNFDQSGFKKLTTTSKEESETRIIYELNLFAGEEGFQKTAS